MADRADDEEVGKDEGATFKREGPEPAGRDSGDTVEEMNDRAAESVINNETPDEATD